MAGGGGLPPNFKISRFNTDYTSVVEIWVFGYATVMGGSSVISFSGNYKRVR